MRNYNTISFADQKGKLTAICCETRCHIFKGQIYLIEFEDGLTSDNEQMVNVYDKDSLHFLCRCNCERFTLLCEEE